VPSRDANEEALFSFFSFSIPVTVAGILAILTLLFLRKRKKTKDFSPFEKRKKFMLLLPIWFPIFLNLWCWSLLQIVFDLGWTTDSPYRAYPEGWTSFILYLIYFALWVFSPLLIFAPWISYLGYWRRKKEAAQKASESRSS